VAKAGAFAYAIFDRQRLVVYLSDRFLRFGLRFPEKVEQAAFSGSKRLKTPF
jgi:hypothetical protein